MAASFPGLCGAVCTLFSLHAFVVSYEVTVIQSELRRCEEDRHACVTDPADCSPPAPSSPLLHKLDMWCDFRPSTRGNSSLTCGWSLDSESEASLVVTRWRRVISCPAVFNPASELNVTARIRDARTGSEAWSEPRTVVLRHAVRPPVPRVTSLSDDSLLVSWTGGGGGGVCRLRYRLNGSEAWTRAVDSVPVRADQTASFVLKPLLPSSAYRAAVSCRGEPGVWTGWSADAGATTRDRAPATPPDVCYRVEGTLPGGARLVRLTWESFSVKLDYDKLAFRQPLDAAGRVSGYTVSYNPGGPILNVTGSTAVVTAGGPGGAATVAAFNAAGHGPAAHVRIDPAGPGDVDPDRSYVISVSPVYDRQCGSARSLPASLQRGALTEAGSLKVVGVGKSSVTVMWAWQNKSGPIRVRSYSVALENDQDAQTRSIWPDQNQLTFFNLTPHTQYSLRLLAGRRATHTLPVNTQFDEKLLATPVCLLVLVLLVVSVLSRTVSRWYRVPAGSDPRRSSLSRWLQDAAALKHQERNLLDLDRFQVPQSLVVVRPRTPLLQRGDGDGPEQQVPLASHVSGEFLLAGRDGLYIQQAACSTPGAGAASRLDGGAESRLDGGAEPTPEAEDKNASEDD